MGRMTDKTLHAPNFLHKNYQRILASVESIITSSDENTSRFISLGADKNNLQTLDNLKFANLSSKLTSAPDCVITYPFLLCASTHANEEKAIIDEWSKHTPENLGLVIAIRHPQRRNEVCKLLDDYDYSYKLHSMHPKNITQNDIYIIDTVGDLIPFINNATLVFMGGSLEPIGGHNVLEPAHFGKCIITGPHYFTFLEIVQDLHACRGIKIVENAEMLIKEVSHLTANPNDMESIGANARKYLLSKQTVLEKYVESTLKILER